MGKYLTLLENWNMTSYNASFTPKNDTITDAFQIAKQKTNDRIGTGLVFFIFLVVYIHLITKENQFNISNIQALLSAGGISFFFSLTFIYLGILNSSQVLIWCVLLTFISMAWLIIRTT